MKQANQQLLAISAQAEQHAAQLLTMLEQESIFLAERNSQALDEQLKHKNTLLSALQRFESQRAKLLNQLGYSANAEGWKKWQDQAREQSPNKNQEQQAESVFSEEALKHCQTLDENLLLCRKLNEGNGKSIARHQQTLKQLITILKGQHNDNTPLYDQRGQTSSGRSQTPPISA